MERKEMQENVSDMDWTGLEANINEVGYGVIKSLLTEQECLTLTEAYSQKTLYRKKIIMARHGFGRGEYQYYNYPLPRLIEKARNEIYIKLSTIANKWIDTSSHNTKYPSTLEQYLLKCHEAGQDEPTPLILKYEEGDYNCLHQDLYGDHIFPLQVAILLSKQTKDFTGGEFIVAERSSSLAQAHVVSIDQGDAVIFPVAYRPVKNKRNGYSKVLMRHGVSRIHSGRRFTLGIIFHDSK
ncbi:2OG-Fe(II) oxygenase [Pseudomonas luteola]|uniref:2OG-Fe(II) oxygenase n=1 Tax=Pseudomonas luteola TaxID=47886 RepID=UPI001EF40077|nr:2OG-Fe(II) oxygenase [Pseudomonas luteola]MCG7374148.1 2OG-Fe(II) oxygenase [Pseudomonas luteola]